MFQFPGLQASSEWNLKGLVKQTVVYISGSILMSNYRMIFCTGHLVRLPRRCILQLKAGACMFSVQAKEENVLTWLCSDLRTFQTVNNGSLNKLLVGSSVDTGQVNDEWTDDCAFYTTVPHFHVIIEQCPSLIFPRRMSVAVVFIWHILSMLPLLRLKCCIATEKNSFKYFG